MITARVEGLAELAAALRELPAELASKNGGPIARALGKGARKVRDRARENAPVKTGRLRNAIIAKRDRNPEAEGHTEQYLIAPRRGKSREDKRGAFYWSFVEFGTLFQKQQAFLRPAFEEKKEEVAQDFATDLRAGIQRAAKKVVKRARR